MKSRVFTTIFDDPQADNAKTFSRHLGALLELSSEDRERCVDYLPGIRSARTSTQERELLDNFARDTGIERHKLVQALRVIEFLVDALVSEQIPKNDWSFWADDLCEIGWLSNEKREGFESLLSALNGDLPALKLQQRGLATAGGVLPTFKSFGFTIEVRPIRKEIYRWGLEVKDYVPSILGTITIASISIGVDAGPVPVDDFYFQADERDLDNIIATLQAAKKEMIAFREYLKISEEG